MDWLSRTEMEKKSHKLTSRGETTICLPITDEQEYQSIIDVAGEFRAYLEKVITLRAKSGSHLRENKKRISIERNSYWCNVYPHCCSCS
jgi:hypothetical protein